MPLRLFSAPETHKKERKAASFKLAVLSFGFPGALGVPAVQSALGALSAFPWPRIFSSASGFWPASAPMKQVNREKSVVCLFA